MTKNTDFLPPIQTDQFLPPISRWTTFGGLFILCVLGLAIPVAAVAKYKVTVKGEAVVRPSGELRIVQAATEGQVMQIYVKENQVVKTGDAIAIIDDSRLQTKKSQLQTNIQQAQLQLVQINAQIQTLNSQIRAETEKVNRIITGAEAEFSDRLRQYQDKKITTVSELQEAHANIQISQQELQIGRSQLATEQANLNSIQAALDAALAKQQRYDPIAQTGALSKNQVEEAQLATKQQQQALKAQKSLIETKKQTIKRLQQAVYVATTRKQRAKIAVNPSDAEVKIATERIAQEKAAGESNKAVLDKERQAIIKQRIEVEKQLERDASELKQVEIEVNQTTITATADGIISQINLRNSGQTVRPGEEILQIVPSDVSQIVKAAVASEDKNKLKIGQQVQMRVSACPYPDYGTLNGKVEAISPDAITPQQNGTNGSISHTNTSPKAAAPNAFYEVTIEPESLVLGKGKNLCHIQLGMEGRVDIISSEETVLQFFLRKARLIADL
ncbi:HlyD family efflux transporter periplasmic adaptor subunit [Cylindrospermum sp. FACHB-282]|uniref:HlyD family efflux transporter periplasmic adaptor subunit n=1 Tax=Cylindrospermum sp. FACHB-282 TaxID=2692794 RepID=UPI00168326FE|nr:HlyD family efflux transporter periplasmic adaptor subunit [Cylindrospermum sp. FACHB-282]MBD2385194.1 HlyD family efflux transporter periplasmic adaptor subunit [Cylindrospermum sp. FACHB-282]